MSSAITWVPAKATGSYSGILWMNILSPEAPGRWIFLLQFQGVILHFKLYDTIYSIEEDQGVALNHPAVPFHTNVLVARTLRLMWHCMGSKVTTVRLILRGSSREPSGGWGREESKGLSRAGGPAGTPRGPERHLPVAVSAQWTSPRGAETVPTRGTPRPRRDSTFTTS